MAAPTEAPSASAPGTSSEFIRGISPLAAVSLVVGSMIGSGIFIVSADISPPGGPVGAGRASAGLDRDRPGHRDWRALLRRAGGDDAQGRRTVRLPARGPLARGGVPLRLDPLRGHPDRHHRGGGGGVRPVPQRARALHQPGRLSPAGPASPARGARRHPARALAPADRGDPLDPAAHRHQRARRQGWAPRSRRCSAWPRSARSRCW